ncbi:MULTISPECIES: BTAD domain-containing putative transcriptional regulator, partial [unclassified Streptomyces]|uniref:BTAD domain-containing putative transcriptional regulator n=1 Tax=unclassified Streptomyces TaxID=2593676 RepID=UPI00081F536E
MRFGLLGRLRILSGTGVPVHLPGALSRAVVARLLLGRGSVVQRDVIIDELWADRDAKDPVNAVQVHIAKVRAAFAAAGEPDRFPHGHGGYRLVLDDTDELDTALFEDALQEGRDHLRAQRYEAAEQRLRYGLSHWRGPALDGLTGHPFDAERARLEGLRLAAVEAAADAGLELGRGGELVPELTASVNGSPLHEGVRRRLMLALHRSGRSAEALAVYEEGRTLLRTELGADPCPELRTLHTAILRQDPAPPPSSAQPRRTPAPGGPSAGREGNLVRPLGPFIGRADDLRALRQRLDTERLVTVVGPGGVGKTRLTLEACGLPAPRRGGVWWVDLAATDSAGVRATVAAALGLSDASVPPGEPPHDPVRRLTAFLADRDTVLALDNCEHVLDAVTPLVGTLLGRCAGLTVVATSREPLALPGEVLHTLAPMSAQDSAELFTVRAAMVNPAFRPDERTRADVLTLVRRLEGLPLAVELAVPHVRMLSPYEITRLLDDRFALLNRGDRTAPARHRTLRAVLDWSYALLDEREQTLLTQLALHVGGCSLRSAEEARLLPGAGSLELVHVMTQLVDKSLLFPVPGESGVRLHMLETVREYARARLREEGREAAAEERFTTWARSFAADAVTGLCSDGQGAWTARTAEEATNLRAATALLTAGSRAVDALVLEARLGYFWFISGREEEGIDRLARTLAAYDTWTPGRTGPPTREEEWAFYYTIAWLSWLSHVIGRHTEARRYGARNQGYWQRASHPDLRVLGPCYDALLALLNAEEQTERVEELFTRAEAGIVGTEHHWDRANLQSAWSQYRLGQGDVPGARDHALTAVEAAARAHDAFSRATCLIFCGDAEESGGHRARAREQWREAAEILRTVGARGRLASALLRLAYLDLGEGRTDAAEASLDEAAALAEALTSVDLTAAAGNLRALLAARRGLRTEAEEAFARVWATAEASPARRAVAGLGVARLAGRAGMTGQDRGPTGATGAEGRTRTGDATGPTAAPPAGVPADVAALHGRLLEPQAHRAVGRLLVE